MNLDLSTKNLVGGKKILGQVFIAKSDSADVNKYLDIIKLSTLLSAQKLRAVNPCTQRKAAKPLPPPPLPLA